MRTEKQKPKKQNSIRVQIHEIEYRKHPKTGKEGHAVKESKSFTVYETTVKELYEFIQNQIEAVPENNDLASLKEWKESALTTFGPIIDYCQNPENSERLGFTIGDKIADRVLKILAEYKK